SGCIVQVRLCDNSVGCALNFRSLRWRCIDLLIAKSGCVVPVRRAVKFSLRC
ncbi:hypothetical protein NDU88_010332, partial [Pleurodeles waltl]